MALKIIKMPFERNSFIITDDGNDKTSNLEYKRRILVYLNESNIEYTICANILSFKSKEDAMQFALSFE